MTHVRSSLTSPASSLSAIAAVRCIGDGFGAILTGNRPLTFSSKLGIAGLEFATNELAVRNFVAIRLPPTLMKESGDDSAKIWVAGFVNDAFAVVRRVDFVKLVGKW